MFITHQIVVLGASNITGSKRDKTVASVGFRWRSHSGSHWCTDDISTIDWERFPKAVDPGLRPEALYNLLYL